MNEKIVVITARSWDPNTNVYSDSINTEGLRYIGNTQTGTIPPCLLVYNKNLDPEILFKTSDRPNDIDPHRLFGTAIPGEVILFVHGFNNELISAVDTASDIQRITDKFVVVFDWPSSHSGWFPSVVQGYARDSEMATTNVRALNWILYFLLDNVNKVHIFSHSMGSRIVAGSLESLVHDYKINSVYKNRLEKLGKLVFKESDIDVINMAKFTSQTVPTINKINSSIQVYIYAHNDDRILGFSQGIHGDYRVGQLEGAEQLLTILQAAQDVNRNAIPLHIVDASICRSDLWLYGNHSYFNDPHFRNSINLALNGDYDNMRDGVIRL